MLVTYSPYEAVQERAEEARGALVGEVEEAGTPLGGGMTSSRVIAHDAMSSDTICKEERPEEWGWCHNKFRSALNHEGILTS